MEFPQLLVVSATTKFKTLVASFLHFFVCISVKAKAGALTTLAGNKETATTDTFLEIHWLLRSFKKGVLLLLPL